MAVRPDWASRDAIPTARSAWVRVGAACAVMALCAVTMILLRPPLALDETRYLSVAWEMWQSRDRLLLHMNGASYTHKPPLLFLLINAVWAIGGVSEATARLVGPLAAVASVAATAALARRLWPDQPDRAGRAALILASAAVFLVYGSTTMFDALLALLTLAGIGAVVAMRRSPASPVPVVALGVALGLGVLTKGPVIVLHVLPVALAMPLWTTGERPRLRAWYGRVGVAVLIAIALVALWLVPASIRGGAAFRQDVLWRQSAGRMVASFAHGRPAWFYLALLPVMLWPWGWTPAGLGSLAPRRLLADEGGRLAAIWFAAAFVGFSLISGKQLHYLLPELPALALVLSAAQPQPVRGMVWLLIPLAAIGLLEVAAVAGAVPDLPVPMAWLSALCVLGAALALVAGVAALRRLARPTLALAALGPAAVIAAHFIAAPALWVGYDPAPLGRLLGAHQTQGIAITDAEYPALFNFAGRLRGPVAVLPTAPEVRAWAAAHPGGILLTRDPAPLPGLVQIGGRDFYGRHYAIMQVPLR